MSNKSKRSATPPKSQKSATPRWLLPAVIGVVAVAVIAGVIWLVQGQQVKRQQTTVTTTTAVTGQPSASINQTKFDYGDVKLGSTIETVFQVKNVGDQALTFQGEPRVEVLEGC